MERRVVETIKVVAVALVVYAVAMFGAHTVGLWITSVLSALPSHVKSVLGAILFFGSFAAVYAYLYYDLKKMERLLHKK